MVTNELYPTVSSIEPIIDGRRLISVGSDGLIFVWRLNDFLYTPISRALVAAHNHAVESEFASDRTPAGKM
jgi:hypothetical protein